MMLGSNRNDRLIYDASERKEFFSSGVAKGENLFH